MSYVQMIEEQDYSASARFDRFDGFDCGDLGNDDRDQGSECIGRVRGEWGGRVEVWHLWDNGDDFYHVTVYAHPNGPSTFPFDTEAQAKACGHWWLAGCPC